MSKVAMVVGASGSIGGAVARALARDGRAVACTYHGDGEAAQQVAKSIEADGGSAATFAIDLADEATVERAFDQVAEWSAPPVVLVNAAGIVRDGLAVRYAVTDLQALLSVNLAGAFLTAKAALRPMLRARWGRIVNIASVVGLIGNPGQAAYAASKAGLVGMTRSLAKEVGSRGITVNAVCPGVVETEMTAGLPEGSLDRLVQAPPAGRAARPEEIASVVRFLAGEEATFVNGAVVTVDGGLTA